MAFSLLVLHRGHLPWLDGFICEDDSSIKKYALMTGGFRCTTRYLVQRTLASELDIPVVSIP